MQIEQIHIKNYKVFKDTKVKNLAPLCVFLGANGSGKSTLFDVLGFISFALKNNVTSAINARGGIKEVISRGCDPYNSPISFEIKFRNPKAFEDDSTQEKTTNPLITYELEISWDEQQAKAIVNKEILKYRRGSYGHPWHFLDFRRGEGSAVTNEKEYGQEGATEKREERKLSSTEILAIKGLGQFEQYRVISDFRILLEKWHISNFNIDQAREISSTGVDEHLNEKGNNLARVTKHIYDHHREVFDEILAKIPQRIPGITKVEAKETEEGNILLKFQDDHFKDPFIGKFVSDGTMKMFAYMILLYDPNPHPLLCIEEPENFLHPDLLTELAEEIREYAQKGGQVLVSTHSPDFVNALDISELFFLIKDQGYTIIKAASDNQETQDLVQDGNQLGWLWRNRYIHGTNL